MSQRGRFARFKLPKPHDPGVDLNALALKKLARQRAGARAKALGSRFENTVRVQLEGAQRNRLVTHFAHNEPHYVMGGKDKETGKPRFVPVAAGKADWSGALWGGIEFAMEAKSENTRRFKRGRISEEQEKHLDACARGGGLAIFTVQFRDDDKGLAWWFVIPWRQVPWEVAISAQSLTMDTLAPFQAREDRLLDASIVVCKGCGMVWPAHRKVSCCTNFRVELEPHPAQRDLGGAAYQIKSTVAP